MTMLINAKIMLELLPREEDMINLESQNIVKA